MKINKLPFIILIQLAFATGLLSQTSITLTFTATYNGLHQPLDSINISNLNLGGDTTLIGNDTVIVLNYGIGIDEQLQGASDQWILYPVTPNPVTQTAIIKLHLPKDETVVMKISDLSGRELASLRQSLQAGFHTFTLEPGRENFYLLSVQAGDCQQVQKLVNLQESGTLASIAYSGYQGGLQHLRKGISAFPWAPGDQLRFVGYSANGTDTLIGQPLQSTQYTFLYSSGLCPATLTDINGNVYNTVLIGNQCWMKENLKARNYRNGASIPLVTDNTTWTGLSTGARCWYNNDSATYANTYCTLYNWFAVDNSSGICPTGWHVPTDAEFTDLTNFLGGASVAGGPLKETGSAHWNSPNTGATNSSGFTALPGGSRSYSNGSFNDVGSYGYWWSSTAYSTLSAWYRLLYYSVSNVGRANANKGDGFSVRCVRD